MNEQVACPVNYCHASIFLFGCVPTAPIIALEHQTIIHLSDRKKHAILLLLGLSPRGSNVSLLGPCASFSLASNASELSVRVQE
jgi:hypothetical protein